MAPQIFRHVCCVTYKECSLDLPFLVSSIFIFIPCTFFLPCISYFASFFIVFSSLYIHRDCITLYSLTHSIKKNIFFLLSFHNIHGYDYSQYDFVELIREKSKSLKAVKAKVEFQQRKKIEVINSDKDGKYYGRYDETGRNPGPFAKYLQEYGIDA